MKILRNIKPPIGVVPYNIYFVNIGFGEIIPIESIYKRVKHLQKAISDYVNANRKISIEWVEELNSWVNYLEEKNVFLDIIKEEER